MGSDDIYKRKKGIDGYKPKTGKKGLEREKILIVCEGEKTEKLYFEKFPINHGKLEVKIVGTGRNTMSLVNETIKMVNNEKREGINQVWCVFDKDSFDEFDSAIIKAERNGFRVAYSNEAFELWFLLHFEYYQNAMSRDMYKDYLNKHLGKEYLKNDENIYDSLLNKQEVAIRNAGKLIASKEHLLPSKANPVTTVHLLVKELNKWK